MFAIVKRHSTASWPMVDQPMFTVTRSRGIAASTWCTRRGASRWSPTRGGAAASTCSRRACWRRWSVITGWTASKSTIKIMIPRLASDYVLSPTIWGCSPPGPVTITVSESLIMTLAATRPIRRSSTRCSSAWRADSEHRRGSTCGGSDRLRGVIACPARQLGIELVELDGRSPKPVQRIQLGSNPLRPPFTSKQVHGDPHRQGMMMQDRVQPAAPSLVDGVVARSGKRLAETEEAAHQRSAAWGQETEALPSPCAANDLLGLVLQNHRLGGDPAHGRTLLTWPTGVLGRGSSGHSKLLGCRGWRRLAASKAAHVPTLLRQPDAATAATSSPTSELLAHRAVDPPPSSSLAEERTPVLAPCTLLAPLAEAGACEPLPSSLARRQKTCLLARSSRTAARPPDSAGGGGGSPTPGAAGGQPRNRWASRRTRTTGGVPPSPEAPSLTRSRRRC